MAVVAYNVIYFFSKRRCLLGYAFIPKGVETFDNYAITEIECYNIVWIRNLCLLYNMISVGTVYFI